MVESTITFPSSVGVALLKRSAITYDSIDNPLNDGTWNYIWESGRQL